MQKKYKEASITLLLSPVQQYPNPKQLDLWDSTTLEIHASCTLNLIQEFYSSMYV